MALDQWLWMRDVASPVDAPIDTAQLTSVVVYLYILLFRSPLHSSLYLTFQPLRPQVHIRYSVPHQLTNHTNTTMSGKGWETTGRGTNSQGKQDTFTLRHKACIEVVIIAYWLTDDAIIAIPLR